jgi:hypothetical protein
MTLLVQSAPSLALPRIAGEGTRSQVLHDSCLTANR